MQAKFGWAVGFILAAFLAVHLHTRVLDQTIVPPPSAVFGIVSGGRTHLLDRDPRPEASFGYYTADPMGSAALYPVDRFILDSWKSGHFPLWNPYVLTGLPLTADGYWQLFYPLNSIRLVIGEGWWDVYSYIHLFLLIDLPCPPLLSATAPTDGSGAFRNRDVRRRLVSFEGSPKCEVGASPMAAAPVGQTSISAVAANSVTLEANVGAPGVLVLTDTFAPGWTASVNGAPSAVLRINGTFRGICLPAAGKYNITMRYLPPLWDLCLLIAGAGMLGWAVLLADRFRHHRWRPA